MNILGILIVTLGHTASPTTDDKDLMIESEFTVSCSGKRCTVQLDAHPGDGWYAAQPKVCENFVRNNMCGNDVFETIVPVKGAVKQAYMVLRKTKVGTLNGAPYVVAKIVGTKIIEVE